MDPSSSFDAQEILPRLWLGSEEALAHLAPLKERDISHILIPAHTGAPAVLFPEHITYLQYSIPDIGSFPLLPLFPEFFLFLNEGRRRGAVLIACAQGRSRSAGVAIGYLMALAAEKEKKKTEAAGEAEEKEKKPKRRLLEDALYVVTRKRPSVSTKFEAQLREHEKNLLAGVESREKRHAFTARPLFSNWEGEEEREKNKRKI